MPSHLFTRALAAAVALGVLGWVPVATGEPDTDVDSTPMATLDPAPPPVLKTRTATAPVSVLHPGAPIMVGAGSSNDDGYDVRLCQLGFYVDFPGSDGQPRPGFLTAGTCADRMHTPVFVTTAFVPKKVFEQTEIGEVSHLSAGAAQPTVDGQPWTIPASPLAVITSRSDWPLPVSTEIDGAPATDPLVTSARSVWGAPAAWTNDFGYVVTGRVLDPATTSELARIPAGVDRVVIAADDPAEPLYPMTRGSAVVAEVRGVRQNLGIVVAVDNDRHWLVVDLISPFLNAHRARLRTAA